MALAIASKILRVVRSVAGIANCTSKVRVVSPHDVLAMAWRVHPLPHALFFIVVAIGDVLSDRAPVVSCSFYTISWRGAVRSIVGHGTHACLVIRVLLRRTVQLLGSAQGLEATADSFPVHQAKHLDWIVCSMN